MREAIKPPALTPGAQVAVIAPASPAEPARVSEGCAELGRLGFQPRSATALVDGYFAGCTAERWTELKNALQDPLCAGIVAVRGGYGTGYLLEELDKTQLAKPKVILGHSDLTSLQVFLWQKYRWVTFYGPMVAGGLDKGAGAAGGYERESLLRALTETHKGWQVDLHGETLARGTAEGVLLGGCLTLLQTTLGTPWELDTAGSILLLEDRGMKPYQVDRALLHLKQAGKFAEVRGVVLGDFPECEAPTGSDVTVRGVVEGVLGGLKVPVAFGVPFGHTPRPLLTFPLGIRARLTAQDAGTLEILEPAVTGK